MKTAKRRLGLLVACAALALVAVPAPTLAGTDLNVCTWLTQPVGDAVGTVSAAPGAVLGPNNGGSPGGDKGPFPISFTNSETLALRTASGGRS